MQTEEPIIKDLVLLGGGHAHAVALLKFASNPIAGLRITLINRGALTPYSGMLPGLIAGHYQYAESHIDLLRLCKTLGVRFIQAEATGLDLETQSVSLKGRPNIHYDLLSINIGSTPKGDVEGSAAFSLPVKPIDSFYARWQALLSELQDDAKVEGLALGNGVLEKGSLGSESIDSKSTDSKNLANKNIEIGIVGSGAAGVEIVLAMQYRYEQLGAKNKQNKKLPKVNWHLVSRTDSVLDQHNSSVKSHFIRVLEKRQVKVHFKFEVSRVEDECVFDRSGRSISLDHIIWCTEASAADWITQSGLSISSQGFIQVNEFLQSVSHSNVFAAGDVADIERVSRPKAGVFAVRQGMPLAENLRRKLLDKKLKPFHPQKSFLSLITIGDKTSVLSKGQFKLSGPWVWKWKNYVDRKFMDRFNVDLPNFSMSAGAGAVDSLVASSQVFLDHPIDERCGGCGAKVSGDVLKGGLETLRKESKSINRVNWHKADDAALVKLPPDRTLVQSIDHFRSFIDDPYLFARVTLNHALSDLYAMLAEPHSAQVMLTLPYADDTVSLREFNQVMFGIADGLDESGCELLGGHTAEGKEFALGMSVNGLLYSNGPTLKAAAASGDKLILTKPIGMGVLLAALMKGRLQGQYYDQVLSELLKNNRAICELIRKYPIKAVTDITGFGLLGHLSEMMVASNLSANLNLNKIAVIEGALDLSKEGVKSSLMHSNYQSYKKYLLAPSEEVLKHPVFPLLFDPQTNGGLLVSVPAAQAEPFHLDLKAIGVEASFIGEFLSADQKQMVSETSSGDVSGEHMKNIVRLVV